ncbi:MAG: sodium:calcium antiporter [Lysobacterales bacterium CG02_land_8_20_14_3_00_62_12]|nr:MAG: sodium:calcium antiporter [Xanthomonadales bacterium CG02_land_8_20_14_3_00_62_12]PJA37620.1 MAG: sodium:calcium antiporter [Xanthomonadales bacterium CG_4_9_14_3_um_filter_62_6]
MRTPWPRSPTFPLFSGSPCGLPSPQYWRGGCCGWPGSIPQRRRLITHATLEIGVPAAKSSLFCQGIPMWLPSLIFVLGLIILTVGADLFIRGAAGLGARFGLSSFVIGMVIVGFGTSAPELAVNLTAAYSGHYDLALGNVVGSNIVNIGLILGLSALLAPMVIHLRMLRVETPLLIATSGWLWLLARDGILARWEGLLLLAAQFALTWFVLRSGRQESAAVRAEISAEISPPQRGSSTLWLLGIGLAGLIGGGMLAVDAAVQVARGLGISELIIGLTVVAIGTSLPELASSAVAAWRGHSDIAVGNIIGSNLFNILFILGITASIQPLPVAPALEHIEIPIMIGFTVLLYLIMRRQMRIGRRAGTLLLLAYLGTVGWQVQRALG